MSVFLLRLPQLQSRIGLSRTAVYERLDEKSPYYDPTFPKPIKLGDGKNPPIAWLESEVVEWINTRIKFSRK